VHVLALDAVGFKTVNDTFGHDAGLTRHQALRPLAGPDVRAVHEGHTDAVPLRRARAQDVRFPDDLTCSVRQEGLGLSECHVVRVPDPGRWGTPSTEAVLGIRDLPEGVAQG
jgi:hypothetical protein